MTGMTYEGSGVRYADMDPFKQSGLLAGLDTVPNIERLGMVEIDGCRGESCHLVRLPGGRGIVGSLVEGLGTKNVVADAMERLTGQSYYRSIAQDTLAMIVNDLVTSGVLPAAVHMYLAAGASKWFTENPGRAHDLIDGWKEACMKARCLWAGGETPTLRDIVSVDTVDLAGSVWGYVASETLLIKGDISDGDAIILVESSGIHANGLTLARDLASRLPDGFLTLLPNGRTYGEALLDPTCIYASLIDECQLNKVDLHYAVNVTGHGWRKLMRHPGLLTYVIKVLPPVPPVLRFIQERGPVSDNEAYGNLNMGAGFALYVPQVEIAPVLRIAAQCGFRAWHAGYIEAGEKKVVIEPLGLEYPADTLAVR